MKCKTQFRNQENRYEIYFAYEDYFGGTKFRSYDEMQEQGEVPNIENNNGMLVCYLHSHYWGTTERVDMINLNGRPTISFVKDFTKRCYEFLAKES